MRKPKPKRVLYLAHHGLGDVIMKVPAIRYLLTQFPQEEVYITAKDKLNKKFLEDFIPLKPHQVLVYCSKDPLLQKIQLIRKIRSLKFDFLIAPPSINLRLSKLLFLISGAKKLLCGTYKLSDSYPHKVHQNLAFSTYFGDTQDALLDNAKTLYRLDLGILKNESLPFEVQPGFTLHFGSGPIELHKRLEADQIASLIKKALIRFPNDHFYLIGAGKSEADTNAQVCAAVTNSRLVNLSNQLSIRQLALLMSHKNIHHMISTDSGPAHLASILKLPTVSIFGPTEFETTGPFVNAKLVRLTPPLPCMPCYGSKEYGIVGCGNNRCIKNLQDSEILEAVERLS